MSLVYVTEQKHVRDTCNFVYLISLQKILLYCHLVLHIRNTKLSTYNMDHGSCCVVVVHFKRSVWSLPDNILFRLFTLELQPLTKLLRKSSIMNIMIHNNYFPLLHIHVKCLYRYQICKCISLKTAKISAVKRVDIQLL